jgi:hypothetical protein
MQSNPNLETGFDCCDVECYNLYCNVWQSFVSQDGPRLCASLFYYLDLITKD